MPRTASTPTSCARIGPLRTTCMPPALVATMPPTVACSRAPRSTAKANPAASAWACSRASGTPAPTVTWRAAASTGSSRSRRRRSTTTSPANGVAPPTSPVLPPCGTSATWCRRAALTISATSSVDPGRNTAGVEPCQRRVQSTQWLAVRSGSVTTCRATERAPHVVEEGLTLLTPLPAPPGARPGRLLPQ